MNEITIQLNNYNIPLSIDKKFSELKACDGKIQFCCILMIKGFLGKVLPQNQIKSNFYGDKQTAENECLLILLKLLHTNGLIDDNFKVKKQK